MQTQTQGASEQAIQHHYDVGNDFYGLWLDETRTYSCALWERDGALLGEAQRSKLEYHITCARARGAGRVLDVGCGWGSMLQALRGAGVKSAVGLTLSASQLEYVRSLALPDTEVRLESWAAHTPTALYDAIISIGAFEHFAVPGLDEQQRVAEYRKFFQRCHDWLRPSGHLSLQTIAYGRATRKDLNAFILKEIFPESDLPTLLEVVRACNGLFEVVAIRNDRLDYARTFKEWSDRLAAQRERAIALVGEPKVKAYEVYQGLFQIGFHTGAMDLLRFNLRRIDPAPPVVRRAASV